MDTPERNQIRAPVSKVEGSPVFNFINNLSPIKPVKPLHITQTFNTFSFASLPSVFTSPHITSQKESRILSRYNCSYPSKLELDSEDGIPTNEGIVMDNSVETRDSEVKTGMTFSCKSVFNLHHGIRRRCLDFDVVGAGRENLEDGSNSSASSLTQGDENIFSSDGQQCIIPEIGVQLLQDASQAPGLLANEELNQNSPKKKRRRMENEGETEGCKRCNCKKSKCLKLYCECFAAGVHCVDPFSCQECFNKPIHEDTILATRKRIESRNPLAFAPKVIRSLDSIPVNGDEPNKSPASARHKIGCNCKKSNCLKKYCECYQNKFKKIHKNLLNCTSIFYDQCITKIQILNERRLILHPFRQRFLVSNCRLITQAVICEPPFMHCHLSIFL
ncbi:hypothetical protein UlMin_009224 [Ulmus minor]